MKLDQEEASGRLASLARTATFSALAALPLCGLVLFFEITRPAHFASSGLVQTQLVSNEAFGPTYVAGKGEAVVRLKGVSAEIRRASVTQDKVQVFSVSDAERAFADATPVSLKPGFETEFMTKDGHRASLRIVSREPIVDLALPNDRRMMDIVLASTGKTVSFAWGPWLYRAEITDKGADAPVVVQKVL
ncbi:MAG: hypothetical protein WBX25_08560 [Rhodomicrobium sp.]